VPESAQWFITAAAVVTAIGLLVKKVIIPGYKGVGAIEDALPVLREVVTTFGGKGGALSVLGEISAQFRTDSGSSLKDSVDALCLAAEKAVEAAEVNRLVAEKASEENRRQITELMNRFEVQRRLDANQSEQQERLLLKVDQAMVKIDQMMSDRAQVATDLTAREKKVDEASGGVASDLTERQRQIDEASSGVASDLAAEKEREK
jgi:hypothetical protein